MHNQIDLDNCSREPIHIPNAIQPHGYFFYLRESDLTIQKISANVAALFGRTPDAIIYRSIDTFLDGPSFAALSAAVSHPNFHSINPLRLISKGTAVESEPFDGIIHRLPEGLVLEWEPSAPPQKASSFSFYGTVRAATLAIQNAATHDAVYEEAIALVKSITDFDRVLIYRFDADWHGMTVAETREDFMDSYLGLRFPAADIPAQARRLYAVNWIRLIADVDYTPSPIIPASEIPLDLSQSTLRSVSPVHLEYMRNMKTSASMSISIMRDGRLWGLISCHNLLARYVYYQTRVACEFIGQLVSQQLNVIEGRAETAYRLKLRSRREQLSMAMARDGMTASVPREGDRLLQLTASMGAAVFVRGQLACYGETPSLNDIHNLIDWLKARDTDDVFSTECLGRHYPEADLTTSAGFLAVSLSKARDSFLLWFRPEIIQTVAWAGKPEKVISADLRMHPRKSFSIWEETMRGFSAPWDKAEIDAALELRNSLLADELARTNEELMRSNEELDSFAQIAAHDLKEPIRGIRSYAGFILEDGKDTIDSQSVLRLQTVQTICTEMSGLLQGLYEYSRVGRMHLAMQVTDLNKIMGEVLTRLQPFILEHKAEILIPTPLPTLLCDAVRSGEVFYNLISNAVKYNDRSKKKVTITWAAEATPVFSVEDDGIGIPPEHRLNIFNIFRRLHGKKDYGGGTGSGLAIVKRIIVKHGGKIWVESGEEGGTVFRFTLEPEVL